MSRKEEVNDTLNGFDERIQVMERRLKNARNARDSYVNYLRGKYPDWHNSTKISSNEPLVNRLATSEYQWDVDRKPVNIPKLPLDHQIDLPTNGPLLENDIRNVKRRLREISEQLKTIRGTRMSMSTEQFMGIQSFTGTKMEKETTISEQLNISNISGINEKTVDRMDEIRKRLRDVRIARTSSPVYTPTEEKRFEMEMIDERERIIEEVRAQQPVKQTNSVRFIEPNEPIKEKEVQQEPVVIPSTIVEEVKPAPLPNPDPQPSSSSLSQMMNYLTQQDAGSSSDSDEPVPIRKESTTKPSASLLSQLLNKPGSDSSSDDEKTLSKPSFVAPQLSNVSKILNSTMTEESDDRRRSEDSKKSVKKDRKRRERSRSRSPSKKTKRNEEPVVEKEESIVEEGEIEEKPKELSARDLERQRLLEEELKADQLEDDEPVWSMRKAQEEKKSRSCPYLDTIDRSVLDFDFEKLCSVSLSHLNVYACMICGKYYQGRGTNTHAYIHALDTDHHVFLNLSTLKFYCLPDNYEIVDPSLEDIKYVLKPTYTKEMIASVDKQTRMARAYDDSTYFPGVVGLNNIKANDYCNAILHALSSVAPLRDYFLREENYSNIKRPPGDKLSLLPQRFGELIRKLWNPRAFRTHVSPHEMLQAVVVCSKKRFQFIKQGDSAEFLTFFITTLHTALNGTQKTNSSIIYKTFRGKMRQYSRKVIPSEDTEEERRYKLSLPEYQETSSETPFLYLTLDLPPAPLYRDVQLQNIIPQVPLHVLLEKFNGQVEKEYKTYKDNIMKRFELLQLPDYLIITYKRFQKNQWFVEKNPTIVNFPICNIDLFDCLAEDVRNSHKYTTYDLIANIVHEGKYEDGSYRVQIVHQGSGKWFELEDLHVKDMLPQMIVLAESYIQVWRLNKEKTREERTSDGIDMDTL